MGVVVVLCAASGLTVSATKIEVLCYSTKEMPSETRCTTKRTSLYTWGNVNHNYTDLSIEDDRQIRNAWFSFWKYTLELYDRPSAPSRAQTPDANSRNT